MTPTMAVMDPNVNLPNCKSPKPFFSLICLRYTVCTAVYPLSPVAPCSKSSYLSTQCGFNHRNQKSVKGYVGALWKENSRIQVSRCQRWKSRREVPIGMEQKAQYRRREETQTAAELFYKASMNLIFYIYIKSYIIHMCVCARAHTHKESYTFKAYDAPH